MNQARHLPKFAIPDEDFTTLHQSRRLHSRGPNTSWKLVTLGRSKLVEEGEDGGDGGFLP
jgi:hypothetical protein